MDVRWDAVVHGNPFGVATRLERGPDAEKGPIDVQVWLFGMLRDPNLDLPVKLSFQGSPRIREVVGALARRVDPEIASRMVAADGGLFRHCRAFVDGMQVESADTLVGSAGSPARMEIILLTAAEGG